MLWSPLNLEIPLRLLDLISQWDACTDVVIYRSTSSKYVKSLVQGCAFNVEDQYHVTIYFQIYDRGELAVSYRWTGWCSRL